MAMVVMVVVMRMVINISVDYKNTAGIEGRIHRVKMMLMFVLLILFSLMPLEDASNLERRTEHNEIEERLPSTGQ